MAYICGSKLKTIFYTDGAVRTFRLLCRRSDCRLCRALRAGRLLKQVEAELEAGTKLDGRYVESDDEVYELIRWFSKMRVINAVYPQKGGGAYILADDRERFHGEPIEIGEELKALMLRIADTPKGKRQSHIGGFGRGFSNLRGKPSDRETMGTAILNMTLAQWDMVYGRRGARVRDNGPGSRYVTISEKQGMLAIFELEDNYDLKWD